MTDFPHLAARLYGTPLLVAQPKLETILGVFERKLTGQPALNLDNYDSDVSAVLEMTSDGIAIVPILGTLVRRSSYLASASGLASYHQIEAMADEAFSDPEVRAVLLEIDSSGGEAGGVFDLAERLQHLSHATGKPLWAIADESAMSAAYALATSAERIWLPRTGEVGSVGVVAVHVDQSAADQADGLRYTMLHSGAHKVDGHAHAPLSESVAADIQADLDQLYGAFVGLVATRRNLPESAVRGTEARVYRGIDAIKAGLADQIGTRVQALAALAQHVRARPSTRIAASPATATALTTVNTETLMSDKPQVAETRPETNQPKIPTAAAAKDSQTLAQAAAVPDQAAIAAEVGTRLRAELAELTQIANQATRLGVNIDPAEALAEGVTPAALRNRVLDMAASADQARDVQVNPPHPDAGAGAGARRQESPLVAAMQRLIAQS